MDLRLGVTGDRAGPGRRQVSLADGGTVAYDRLLLATGASPRRLNAPGGDLDGVLYLRRVGDSERLQAALRGGGQVVTVGGGWIGLEVTAAARQVRLRGHRGRARARRAAPATGPRTRRDVRRPAPEHGVVFRIRESVTELRGSGGKVTGAVTSSGAVLPADLVVVGIGAIPSTGLAADARPGRRQRRHRGRRAAHFGAGRVRGRGRRQRLPSAVMESTSEWSTGPTR